MEAVSWVCDDALEEHLCVSEQTISLQKAKVLEALQYDRKSVQSPVGNVMVLCTNQPQQ